MRAEVFLDDAPKSEPTPAKQSASAFLDAESFLEADAPAAGLQTVAKQPAPWPDASPAPSLNMARGAIERGGDLLGGMFTAGNALAEKGEESYPLGGLVWEKGLIPDYKGPEAYAKWRAEQGGDEPLKLAAEHWKNADAGYQENHTWDKVKQEFSEGGALSGSAWAEVMAYGAEQGVKSIPDMVAALVALPAYITARSGEIGEERAKNKGKAETELVDVLEAAPAAIGSAILERIGAKGITEAGAEALGKEALKQGFGNVVKGGVKAGGKEAFTEGVQEGVIEYLGEKLGTDAAMSVAEAFDRGAAGAVAGGVYGTGAGTVGAAVNQARKPEQDASQGTERPAPDSETPAGDWTDQLLREADDEAAPVLQPTDDKAPVNDYDGRPEWATDQTNIFRDGVQPEPQAEPTPEPSPAEPAPEQPTAATATPTETGQAADDLSPYERNQLRDAGVTDEQLWDMPTKEARARLKGAKTEAKPKQSAERFLSESGTGVFRVPVDQIKVDPEQYQFRSRVNEQGVDKRLDGVKQWDDKRAGNVLLHRRENGDLYVADGHHRVDLARRLGQPALNARVVDEADGVDVATARVEAAMNNVADGKAEPIDVAKVFRDSEVPTAEVRDTFNLPNNQVVRDGEALSRLSDNVFGMVTADQLSEKDGAAIGAAFTEQAQQEAAADAFQKVEPQTDYQRQLLVNEIRAAEFAKAQGDQGGLFGEDPQEVSLMQDRLKVLDALRQKLNSDKRLFKSLNDNADRATSAGNQIATEANATITERSARSLDLIGRVTTTPALNDMVNRAARRVFDGEPKATVVKELKQELLNYETGTATEGRGRHGAAPGLRANAEPGPESGSGERVPAQDAAGSDQGGQPESGPQTEVTPALELEAQTEAQLAEQARTRDEAAQAEAEQRKQEEQRATADEQVNGFTLTGSNRTADVAMAAGQDDMFVSTPASKKAQEKPDTKTGDPALDPDRVRAMAEGANRARERESQARQEQMETNARRRAENPVSNPEWQTVEGVEGKRIGDDPFVAVPASGRRNAARFEVIDLRDRTDAVTTLKSLEVDAWLQAAHERLKDEAESPAEQIEQAASEVDQNPSEAQKEAGNYKKGHVSVQGLDIALENPKGSTRSGTDPDGNQWESTMAHHYGYIKRSEGADGDHVDVFIGPDVESDRVFVIDQVNADGSFDEHKVMLGFKNQAAARKGYRDNYEKGWTVGPTTRLSMDEFKTWLKDGDTTKPLQPAKAKQPEKVTWTKDGNRLWHGSNGMIIADLSMTVGGNRAKFFAVFKDDESRDKGDNFTSGETLAEAKEKALAEPAVSTKPRKSAKAEPQKAAPENSESQTVIDDFGEKLGGARKDRVKVASLDKELTDDDIAKLPLSKIWPKSEIDAIEEHAVAAFMTAVRAEIPSKPRKPYYLKRWVGNVKSLRTLAKHYLEDPSAFNEKVRDSKYRLEGFMVKVDVLAQVDRKDWSRIESVRLYPDAYSYDPKTKEKVPKPAVMVRIDGRNHSIEGAGTVAEAIDGIRKLLGEQTGDKKMKFTIRGSKGDWFVHKEGDPEYRRLKTFDDPDTASRYRREHYDDLVAEWEAVKERDNVRKSDVRRKMNRPRTGQDYRNGEDVTPEQFEQTFGFRGVEFGNWLRQGKGNRDRQGILNSVFDAFMDLANIVGVPPRAISLNGTLGLGLGSRGGGWAAAHFEPGNLVINLTKTKGAGALAHEWFHALDNYFARQRGGEIPIQRGLNAQQQYREQNFITYRPEPLMVFQPPEGARASHRPLTAAELKRRQKAYPEAGTYAPERWAPDSRHPNGVRPEVEQRFSDLVEALDASPMRARSRTIDQGKADGYWSQIIERAARSFENYVIAKMQAKGYDNDFLANVMDINRFARNPQRYPYLMPEEVAPVERAFDALFDTIEAVPEGDQYLLREESGIPYYQVNEDQLGLDFDAEPERERDTGNLQGQRGDAASNEGAVPAGRRPSNLRALRRTRQTERQTVRYGVEYVQGPADAAHVLAPFRKDAQETMLALVLDAQQRPLAIVRNAKGSRNAASVSPLDLVGDVVSIPNAHSVWLSHNHPSGSLTPSQADHNLNDALRPLLEAADVKLRGHVLLAYGGKTAAFGRTANDRQPDEMSTSAAPRKMPLPVLERTLGNPVPDNTSIIRDPKEALRQLQSLADPSQSGLLLLDNRHQPVGFLDLTDYPLDKLKENGVARQVLEALTRTNANAIIAQKGEGQDNSQGTNLGSMLKWLADRDPSLRLLDLIDVNEGVYESRAERGALPSGGVWFSRDGYRLTPNLPLDYLTVSEANAIRDELMLDWSGAPEVIIRDEISQFPQELQLAIRVAGAENDMRGVLWGDDVYLLASRIPDRQAMERVILHEVIGHYGLRKMLGKDMERVLNQIWASHGGKTRADFIIRRYYPGNTFNVNDKDHRHTVAEELIAHLAEQNRGQTLVQRAVAIIREGLRKLGFTLEFTVDDIVNLLRRARKTVENGGFERDSEYEANAAPASRYSKQRQTDTDAFKKWFGDSKVVDENGEPLVVYHGTGTRFDTFDESRMGSFTGAESATEGFFFTDSRGLAGQFRDNAQRARMRLSEIRSAIDALTDSRIEELADDLGLVEEYYTDGREFVTDQVIERLDEDRSAYFDDRSNFDGPLKKYIDPALFDTGEVKSVYLAISNPREVTPDPDTAFDDGLITREVRAAKAAGNDGLIVRGMLDTAAMDDKGNNQVASDVYVAFRPEQIKSATGNSGTFDPGNPDIRFSRSNDDLTPELDERRDSFIKGLATQPIDRMFRAVFDVAGLVDAHGRFKPGVKITEGSERIIKEWHPSESGVFRWLDGPLEVARHGLIDRYKLTADYKMAWRQSEAYGRSLDNQVQDILETLEERGVNGAEAAVLQKILTGEQVENRHLNAVAEPVLRAIDDLGQAAVEYGIITREQFERNRGTYLHRSYLKHESDFTGLGKWIHNRQRKQNRKIKGETAKGRGISIKVPMDTVMKHVPVGWFGLKKRGGQPDMQALTGQKFKILENPGVLTDQTDNLEGIEPRQQRRTTETVYWPASQPVPAKYDAWRSRGTFEVRGKKSGKVVLWRDYTKAERANMGEILDARYNIAKTFQLLSKDLAMGKFFQDVSQNAEWFQREKPDSASILTAGEARTLRALSKTDWVQVPDTIVSQSAGTKQWGALSGGYVRAEIWRDLNELDKMHNPGMWRKILTQWKLNKTARSPVVHMNNVMSNLVLMDLADVRVTDLWKGINSYRNRDEHFRAAQEFGAFEGTFVHEEIRRRTLDPILDELTKQGMATDTGVEGTVQTLSRMAYTIWTNAKKVDNMATNFYQIEDELFRMATYMRRLDLGDAPADAARMAREQFLDYDIRAPWVNALRRTVMPFIAYTYRAVPVVAESVIHRPWKLAKYATIAHLATTMSYMLAPGDEDEERRTMRDDQQGPTWIGTPRMLRMPWHDEHGNPVFMDIRRWIPAGDVFDMNQGNSALPIPAPIQFGGPLMLGFEFALNKQAFTGEEIVSRDTDTAMEAAGKTADWLYKSWMPSAAYVPGSYYWEKVWRASDGARDILGRPYSVPQALLSSIGIKVQPHDVRLGYEFRSRDLAAQARIIQGDVRRAQGDLKRNIITKHEFNKIIRRARGKMELLNDKQKALMGKD